jgi:endonuclease/exonuclease/phosphatase family metal-dependent hydrolase
VGPVVYVAPAEFGRPAATDRLAVVTWNVHVGSADVGRLIRALRHGEYTGGRPVDQFVLMLQEVCRRDEREPLPVSPFLPVPRHIGCRRDDGDLERVAREARLALFYAPSMRNGAAADAFEDRGNAIVSTGALLDPTVIELPLEHQRRAAIAAAVEGITPSGTRWHVRVVDAHLDTALALMHGGPASARRRQADALITALADSNVATVVGGDFNTWLPREAALQDLREAFPESSSQHKATWRGPLGIHANLDHFFARGPVHLDHIQRLPDRFGSDHYPVLGILTF